MIKNMDIALIIFLILSFGSFYFWRKNNDKNYFWFMWIGVILIINHILSHYLIGNLFSSELKIISDRFFLIFDPILYILAIWFIFNGFKNNKNKEWVEFLVKMKDNLDYVYIGMIIERGGKFLLLEPCNIKPDENYLRVPHSDEINEKLVAFKVAKQSLRNTTGLNLLKVGKYLGTLDGISNSGERIRILNYLCKIKNENIKLNPGYYRAYYWVAIGDDQFQKVPKPIQNILLDAQKYISENKK